VLNKYFPPDFDPALVPRRKRAKNNEMKIRMMLPFSMRCTLCGEYMYRGKKFNSRKEDVPEEAYLGIMVFRFYIKCLRCNAEITFKTDPQNSDYTAEHGCSRNFEPWRDKEQKEEALNDAKEEEEKNDAMKKLENVTKDSKREMDILDALDEVRMINARNNEISSDQLLADLRERADKAAAEVSQISKEEEDEVKMAFSAATANTVKRLEEEAPKPKSSSEIAELKAEQQSAGSVWAKGLQKPKEPVKKAGGRFGVLKRKVADEAEVQAEKEKMKPADSPSPPGGLGLLGGYGSSGSGSGSGTSP